jgi:hypothetical protein
VTVAQPEIDTDITVLEDLDFELPCAMRRAREPQWKCPDPARWIITLRPHCKFTVGTTFLICQDHYERIIGGWKGTCPGCREKPVIRDFIIRLEPLNPTTGDHQ